MNTKPIDFWDSFFLINYLIVAMKPEKLTLCAFGVSAIIMTIKDVFIAKHSGR